MGRKQPNPGPPDNTRQTGRLAVSIPEMEAAFTEWDRRYREEPGRFMSEAQHLLKETPESYGEACAPYFAKILEEIKGQ